MTSDFSESSIVDTVKKATAAYKEKLKNNEKDAEKPPSVAVATKTAAGEFKKYSQEDLPAAIEETANLLAEFWTRAEDPETVLVPSVPRVEDTPESRERGRLLYLSDNTKCYTCHGMTGRGDGSSTEDFWKDPFTNQFYEKRGLHDIWGNPLKPRNLTLGQYRGGRRPIDLFRRLYVGIKATPMPAFGGGKITDEQLWDIVNYVMSLPYSTRQPSSEAAPKGHVAKLDDKPAH
jgi:mono/diheme cytochrome c family protein